jgi:23S rRNA (uridine2552-2'-O)-methyltransferase
MPKRSKSSARWLQEHFADAYVRRAQAEGWRSRAVFKLMDIQKRDRLLRPGMTVVDLGAAPGGWSQYAAVEVGAQGAVIALDRLPIAPMPGVVFIEADFAEDSGLAALEYALEGRAVDLVLSDMAPNISGIKMVDQPRGMYLAELALDFARRSLASGGGFLVKAFQGEGFDEFLRALRQDFKKVSVRKPPASRARSREVYLLGRDYRYNV